MTQKIERLYEFLADEEDARVCRDIDDAACRVIPGNFFLIFISQFLTRLADALASTKIVLPWVLTSAGAPSFFSGLLVPVRESGSLLPQLIIGGFIRRHAIRKWFFVAGSVLQGVTVVAMALVGLRFTGATAGYLIVLLLIVFSLARGLCSVASKDVLGKTIPKTRRGLISGYCASAAGLVTIGAGAGMLFVTTPDSEIVSLLLITAGICWIVGAGVYAGVREYSGASDGGGNALAKAFASLSLLKTDKAFRNFLVVRCLLISSGLSAPYFIILARQSSMDSSLIILGFFIIAAGIADLVSGIFWGRYADRSSRGVMFFAALAAGTLCGVAGILALDAVNEGFWPMLILFFLLNVVHQGVRLGRKTYVVDLASGNRRTDYTAVGNSVIGVVLLLAGVVGAGIAQLSISAVMALFAVSCFLAAAISRSLPEV